MIDDWPLPERTERHLRSVREFGHGVAEQRIVDGICLVKNAVVDRELAATKATGFRVSESLQIFGGESIIQSHCPHCVANIALPSDRVTFAGCYGMLPLPENFVTRDRWYLQWLDSPLDVARTTELTNQLPTVAWPNATDDPEFQRLTTAVAIAASHALPLHAQMIPAGQIVDRRWILPPHCGRCGVAWKTSHSCSVCGGMGTQRSGLKRHMRGNRPYLPLTKIVGPDQAGELLRKARMPENQR